jgi:hypothetical protein
MAQKKRVQVEIEEIANLFNDFKEKMLKHKDAIEILGDKKSGYFLSIDIDLLK